MDACIGSGSATRSSSAAGGAAAGDAAVRDARGAGARATGGSRPRWRVALAAMAVALAMATTSRGAFAATTTTVVDIPVRGATQRFLYVRPAAPTANLVFLPGGPGIFDIQDDGTMPSFAGRCAPIGRNRDALAAQGIAVALVDRTSDGQVRQIADIRKVVRYMRDRDRVPTWIVGASGSTVATLAFAASTPARERLGLIILSPWGTDFSRTAFVKLPTLIVYHVDDAPSAALAGPLFEALIRAPARERIGLSGGTDEGCSHHLFAGIDDEFVTTIAAFIRRHDLMGRAGSDAPGRQDGPAQRN